MGDARMKKNMIRMAGLALSLFLMAGCSGGRGNMSEKDFDIYENGKCIATIEEAVEKDKDGFHTFDYSREGRKLYPGLELETRRGIGIGSTIQEMTEAYSGILVRYLGPENEKIEASRHSEDILINDFFKRIADYSTEEYNLLLNGWMIDDRVMDINELHEYREKIGDEKIHARGGVNLMISFDMRDNIVENILIMRWDF